jgi:adenosylhomocysteine nucleosidase
MRFESRTVITGNSVSDHKAMHRIVVLAASERELAPIRTIFGLSWKTKRGCLGSFWHEVGLVGESEWNLIKTGVGPDRAREASETALSMLAPDALLSTGYAGSLGVASVGELILGMSILDWAHGKAGQKIQSDPALLERARAAARDARIAWSQGPVVTVGRMLWRASEKQALGVASGAIAVDMESAAIAKVASMAGIPFLLVRAISDRAQDNLPMDFNLWYGPFGLWRCVFEVCKRPSILYGLYEMKQQADQASESLRRFFCALSALLESGVPPPGVGVRQTVGAR